MHKEFSHNGKSFNYRLEKKNRKSLTIRIKSSDDIIVLAPFHIENDKISEFLKTNLNWVLQTLNSMRYKDERSKISFEDGETFLMYGKKYPLNLNIIENIKNRISLDFDNETFNLNLSENLYIGNRNYIKTAFINLYRLKAEKILQNRVDHFSQIMDLEYNIIRIKNLKSKWGSCSSKKNLNFDLKIVMAPENVIDYLVIHELSHLKHMNHSSNFWKYVEEFCPNFKSHKRWLKVNGFILKEFNK